VPVTARAAQILTDLGVGIVMRTPPHGWREKHSIPETPIVLPTGWLGKAVEVDQRNAVDHRVADLDDAAQSGQSLLIDLFVGQELRS